MPHEAGATLVLEDAQGYLWGNQAREHAMVIEADSRPVSLPNGSVVHSDPQIHSGAPVFVGTRVPVQTFVDYLEGGYDLDEFLDHFPSVRREQAIAFIEQATHALLMTVA